MTDQTYFKLLAAYALGAIVTLSAAYWPEAPSDDVLDYRKNVVPGSVSDIVGDRIAEGVATKDHLWLRSLTGVLAVHDFGAASTAVADVGVRDIIPAGDAFYVLKLTNSTNAQASGDDAEEDPAPERTEYTLLKWNGEGFQHITTFAASSGFYAGAYVPQLGQLAFVFDLAVMRLDLASGHWIRTPLVGGYEAGFIGVSAATATDIYIGYNNGEFGGGLRKINFATGGVLTYDRGEGEDSCDQPLHSDCQPVTALMPDAAEPDRCVLAAVGMLHFFARGQIVRVCGPDDSVVVEKKITVASYDMTEAFFGLAPTQNGYWALGHRKLYRMDQTGDRGYRLPSAKKTDLEGVWISRALPGLVLVWSSVIASHSLSGATPLLAPVIQTP
jgi:hypothetical protein